MKTLPFSKYHGTGNDFIIIDNRNGGFSKLSTEVITSLCDRRFGIGADGLILLELESGSDFRMKYYNADGRESSMCGNGGRCITAFANHLGLINNSCVFIAIDGMHEAKLLKPGDPVGLISLKMKDVVGIKEEGNAYILDTGSPHYVTFCDDTNKIDLKAVAHSIRYSDRFRDKGINVNFVAGQNGSYDIRTYERGVEDETYSCGTGTVAAAIAVVLKERQETDKTVKFTAPGGNLEVSLKKKNGLFTDIWLTGEATRVFDGTINLKKV